MLTTRLYIRLFGATAAAVMTTQCADVAAPRPEKALSLAGSHIVRYPTRYAEVSRYMVEGTRVGPGCVFNNVGTLQPGETFVFESVVEFDPENCISIVARHPVSETPAHALPPSRDKYPTRPSMRLQANSATSAAETDPPHYLFGEEWHYQQPAGGTSQQQASLQQQCPEEYGLDKGVFQNLWHEDPPGFDVSRSEHSGYWFYHSGTCVQYVRHSSYLDPLEETGWVVAFHDIDFIWHGVSYVDMDSWGQFRNSPFCAGSSEITWTHYWPNRMRVFHDGYSTFWWPS
jgi:hypothetical protein